MIDEIIKNASRDLKLDIKVSGGDRTKKRNKKVGGSKKSMHLQKGGARDVSVKNLNKKDRERVKQYMVERGYHSLDETRATKGTGAHLHFDKRKRPSADAIEKTFLGKRKFVPDYPIRELKAKSEKELAERQATALPADIRKLDESRLQEPKLTLKQKLEQLSKIDPQGSNTTENIEAVLENNPDKLVPQITKDTPRLAMRQDQDGTLLEKMRRVSKGPKRDIDTSKEERAEATQEIVQSGQAQQRAMGEQLIQSQPEAVSEVVKNLPDLDENTAKDVEKDIQAKAQGKQRAGGPTSQFTEALTFFLPQVIGGLAGAAFEGTEGAIGGIQQAGAARDAFLKHKMEKERLASTTGKSDLDRRRVEIAEANLGLRGEKLGLDRGAEARREKQLDLNTKKFGLSEKQAGQLSGKQVDQLKDMNNVGLSIDRIEELRQEVNTGPLAGRVQSMAQWADAAPESFNKMKAQTASTLSNYVKSISGAQVAEAEAIRLQAVIPSVNDAPGVFKSKLDEFKKIVDMNKKAFAQAITTGQPLKAGAVKGLLEAEKKFAHKKIKSGFSREDIDAMKARIRAERK